MGSATNNLLSQSLGIISHALNNASTSSIASQSLPSPTTNSNAASNIAAVLNSQSNVLSQLSTLFPQAGSSSSNSSNIPYASNLYNILNNPSNYFKIIVVK